MINSNKIDINDKIKNLKKTVSNLFLEKKKFNRSNIINNLAIEVDLKDGKYIHLKHYIPNNFHIYKYIIDFRFSSDYSRFKVLDEQIKWLNSNDKYFENTEHLLL